ncbi:mucin-12-like [Xiphophorus couchianus]|uniref:mucin-12-like n=1 Tax=Xiphophorus couchianus TaxID=32473 RepID=UPI001015FE57|nr:mucin-12-like [Xiphophorus couchianus]
MSTPVSTVAGLSSSDIVNETTRSPEATTIQIGTEPEISGEGSAAFADKSVVTIATAFPTSAVSDGKPMSPSTLSSIIPSVSSSTTLHDEYEEISTRFTTVESIDVLSESSIQPDTASKLIVTDPESAGQTHSNITDESMKTTAVYTTIGTKSASVSESYTSETSDLSKTAVTPAVLLRSTAKPTLESTETEQTFTTSHSQAKSETSFDTSSSAITDGRTTNPYTSGYPEEMSSKHMESPTGSSLISPETTTAEQIDSFSTELRTLPSVSSLTEKPEKSVGATTEDMDGSGTPSTDLFTSSITVIGASSSLYSIDTTTVTTSPESESASVRTEQGTSGENITKSTETPITKTTSGSSAFNILSVSTSRKAETSDTLKTDVSSASALQSTEEPTSMSSETYQTLATVKLQETSAVPEESSKSPITREDRTSKPTSEMSSRDIESSTGSSLFSTEKTTNVLPKDDDSVQTGQTTTPSLSTVTGRTESSSAASPVDRDYTRGQTIDMSTPVSTVAGLSSSDIVNETTRSPEAMTIQIGTEPETSGEGSAAFADKSVVTIATAFPTSAVSDGKPMNPSMLSSIIPSVSSSTTLHDEFEEMSTRFTTVESIDVLSESSIQPDAASKLIVTDESMKTTAVYTTIGTKSASVSESYTSETSDVSKTAVTPAVLLRSTAKPTLESTETEQTFTTSHSQAKSETSFDTSSSAITDGRTTNPYTSGYPEEMSSKHMESPTGSSLISPETTTAEQIDSFSTELRTLPSVSSLTEKPEKSVGATTEDMDGSGTPSTDLFTSSITVIGASYSLYSIDTTTVTTSPQSESASVRTEQGTSGENITKSTETPITKTTSGSSAFNILSVSTSRKAETSDTSKTDVSSASALQSTEEPTSMSSETYQTLATVKLQETSAVPEESSKSPITREDRTSKPTSEMSSRDIASSTGSSLFSTEKTTNLLPKDDDSVQTGQTTTPSLSTVTGRTESSSAASPVDRDYTRGQTIDMSTPVSTVAGLSSSDIVNETTRSPEAMTIQIGTEPETSGEGSAAFADKSVVTIATAFPTSAVSDAKPMSPSTLFFDYSICLIIHNSA